MKTKAIVATLLVAAAASADARFAWPYPPKAVSPDESGHWVVINGNAWSHDMESELTTASPSGGGPDGLKSSPSKEKMPYVAERSPWCCAQQSRRRFHVFVKCRSSNA
jgi:hypothetical protein